MAISVTISQTIRQNSEALLFDTLRKKKKPPYFIIGSSGMEV